MSNLSDHELHNLMDELIAPPSHKERIIKISLSSLIIFFATEIVVFSCWLFLDSFILAPGQPDYVLDFLDKTYAVNWLIIASTIVYFVGIVSESIIQCCGSHCQTYVFACSNFFYIIVLFAAGIFMTSDISEFFDFFTANQKSACAITTMMCFMPLISTVIIFMVMLTPH